MTSEKKQEKIDLENIRGCTMNQEWSYSISPGLKETLLAACPIFKETLQQAREAIVNNAEISNLASEFDLVAYIIVTNYRYHSNEERPIFQISDIEPYFSNPKWISCKEKRYNHATRVAQEIIDTIEDQGKLPAIINYKDKIVCFRHIENANKYYCLPSEAIVIKQKAVDTYEKMLKTIKEF